MIIAKVALVAIICKIQVFAIQHVPMGNILTIQIILVSSAIQLAELVLALTIINVSRVAIQLTFSRIMYAKQLVMQGTFQILPWSARLVMQLVKLVQVSEPLIAFPVIVDIICNG